MKMIVIGNFGVTQRMIAGNFPEPGTWYDFFTGQSFNVSNTGMEMLFQPGEFHIYTTKKIEGVKPGLVLWGANFVITSLSDILVYSGAVFQNPAGESITIEGVPAGKYNMKIIDLYGRLVRQREISMDTFQEEPVHNLLPGLYFINLTGPLGKYQFKLIKN